MSRAPRGRVLVVDDDGDIRDATIELLHDEGFEAVGAPDGDAAIDLARRAPGEFSAILLDAMMPGMDGLSFLAIRAADAALADIPVIVFTADRQLEHLVRAHRKTSYLLKPVKRRDLIAAIAQHC